MNDMSWLEAHYSINIILKSLLKLQNCKYLQRCDNIY